MEQLISKPVEVGAYGGREYSGRLLSIDRHFNIALKDAREIHRATRRVSGHTSAGSSEVKLGLLLIRGECVAYVAECGGGGQEGMEPFVKDENTFGGDSGREEHIGIGDVLREAFQSEGKSGVQRGRPRKPDKRGIPENGSRRDRTNREDDRSDNEAPCNSVGPAAGPQRYEDHQKDPEEGGSAKEESLSTGAAGNAGERPRGRILPGLGQRKR